jgi:opacity protein-like surface antigen
MNHSVVIGAVLCLTIASSARAERLLRPSDRTGYWDFTIQTRYTAAQDFSGAGGSKLSIQDDLGWGFGVGYNLNERLNIGGFVSWRTLDYSAIDVSKTDPTNTTAYSGWLDTGNFAASAIFNLLPKAFTPYVQGTVGWAMVDTNIPSGFASGCWWDPWWGYICDGYATTYGKDGVAYSLGGGISLQPMDIFFLRVGYDRMWVDIDEAADSFDLIRVDAGFLYR